MVIGSVRCVLLHAFLIDQRIPDHSNVAWMRITTPAFTEQLGRDPDQLVTALELLAKKLSL